jgi:hypothetical protein
VTNSAIHDSLESIFTFILATLDSKTECSDAISPVANLETSLEQLSLGAETTDLKKFLKAHLEKWREQIGDDEFKTLLQKVDIKRIEKLRNILHIDW